MNEPTADFLKNASTRKAFHDVISIVLSNIDAEEEIYLIGGTVYRTLAQEWYGIVPPDCDFDFLISKPLARLIVPNTYVVKTNKHGNPKLVSNKISIDFVPLNTVHSIKTRELEPTLENYLTGVPLTVQSIAYDVKNKRIIGNIGLRALQERSVKINNPAEFAYYCEMKNKKPQDIIREKAESLSFSPDYDGLLF